MEPSHPADRIPLSVLAAAANDGDASALEHLLARLHVPVHRFYRAWLFAHRDREEVARDLAQEALLRIAKRLAGCGATSDGTLVAWCLAVARSTGLDYLRRGRAERDAFAFAEEVEALGGGPGAGAEPTEGLQIVLHVLREAMDWE
jgi:DNA-directed RNA polymerase specialized sigma24 family protein